MTEMNISQAEADALMQLEKIRVDDKEWELPGLRGRVSVPLISRNKRENFSLDLSIGRIDLKRRKYQNRTRDSIVLVRLDFGSPHRNPDGEEVGIPHLHLYKEDYADKWAYQIPDNKFNNLEDFGQTLLDFMEYCNIVEQPNFKKVLFS